MLLLLLFMLLALLFMLLFLLLLLYQMEPLQKWGGRRDSQVELVGDQALRIPDSTI
jgi:cell division septal protein FtsQ